MHRQKDINVKENCSEKVGHHRWYISSIRVRVRGRSEPVAVEDVC